MAWYHRISFAAMVAAVRALKHRSDDKHEQARICKDPAQSKKLHDKGDQLNEYANEFKEAIRQRQDFPE